MVDFSSPAPVSVGLIAWPRKQRAATIVLKMVYEVRPDGSTVPSPRSWSLSFDVRALDGALLYPSDWVPRKASSEVIIIGEEARPSEVPVQLTIGSGPIGSGAIGKSTASAKHPGPVEGRQTTTADWGGVSFDFARFQSAPVEQRLPRFDSALELSFVRGKVACSFSLSLPRQTCVVSHRAQDGTVLDEPVELTCDTVLLEPRARRLILLSRGFAEPLGGWGPETSIRCNPLGTLDGFTPAEMAAWPRVEAARFGEWSPQTEEVMEVDEMSSTVNTKRSPAAAPIRVLGAVRRQSSGSMPAVRPPPVKAPPSKPHG